MTLLPIVKNDMGIFENQVFCSKDFYSKKTLVLYVHDPPDVVVGPNAVVSSKMDLGETFLVWLRCSASLISSSTPQIGITNGLIRWISV
jgi:Arb2 domain